jgi:phospholipid/cholesterol/gamma-HCH transport system substrate-binding protein
LPSQQQLRWSQLKVGVTVIVASVILFLLVFMMSGITGLFTTTIKVKAYFDNAEGLRNGQPVALSGVSIGNVQAVHVISGRKVDPVEVIMRINKKFAPLVREGTTATIETQGVLGDAFIDLDSRDAEGGPVPDGAILKSKYAPGLPDVFRSSQTSLQKLDILVTRVDHIVEEVDNGKGSLGKFINDPALFNRATAVLNQIQGLLNDVSAGKGTVGRLLNDETLANKLTDSVDRLDRIMEETESGKNNLGKVLHDESLYNNLHQTVTKANKLMDDLNSGRGPAGKLLKDEALAKKLENTINKLSAIADRLEAGEGSAGRFLKDPSLYNNTDQLLVETRGLIKAVRENPKKYLTIHLKVF